MKSKIAIVTGYSSGLGYEFCKKLLEKEWIVIGISRNKIPLELEKSYTESLIRVEGSVSDEKVVKRAFDIAKSFGQPSLLINCAGAGVFGEIGTYSSSDIKNAIEGNLEGLILCTDTALREFNNGDGKIVNVMSTASKKLRPMESVYVAVKWGAKAYTRTVREAIKLKKLPIKVYEVYPCGMNTSFWDDAIRPVASRGSFPEPYFIAEQVLTSIFSEAGAYQQEFTFERS